MIHRMTTFWFVFFIALARSLLIIYPIYIPSVILIGIFDINSNINFLFNFGIQCYDFTYFQLELVTISIVCHHNHCCPLMSRYLAYGIVSFHCRIVSCHEKTMKCNKNRVDGKESSAKTHLLNDRLLLCEYAESTAFVIDVFVALSSIVLLN